MIKFFRKIRQNLLSEGKTGKYFKYAIGEIILVVIGILIALQVNNWNENRLQNQKIRVLKEALLRDFDDNKTILNSRLIYTDELVSRLIRFLQISDKPELKTPRDSIQYYAIAGLRPNNLKLRLDTYNQAINTGDLNSLNSKKLTTFFTEFLKHLDYYEVHMKIGGNEFYNGSIYELRVELGNLDNLDAFDHLDHLNESSKQTKFTSHLMTDNELRNFISKKEVFAVFHNQLTIQYNFKEAIENMMVVNDSITKQLKKELND
jgi:hypothetical protein